MYYTYVPRMYLATPLPTIKIVTTNARTRTRPINEGYTSTNGLWQICESSLAVNGETFLTASWPSQVTLIVSMFVLSKTI